MKDQHCNEFEDRSTMDETMTELERAEETRDALYWGLGAIEKQVPMQVAYYEALARMHQVWRGEVQRLEAVEKQAPASDEPKTDVVLERLAELERNFESHAHSHGSWMVGQTSLPVYP